jgi:PAS domain S-box-containing protein
MGAELGEFIWLCSAHVFLLPSNRKFIVRTAGGSRLQILFLEDNQQERESIAEALSAAGLACEFAYARNEPEFEQGLARSNLDLIICDFALPGFNGAAALAAARRLRPEVPFIVVSGAIGEERAVECLKGGATDYVLKERLERLGPAVRRVLRESQLVAERRVAEEDLRLSEERFRSVWENSLDGMRLTDRRGCIVAVNEAFCQLVRLPRERLVGQLFSVAYHGPGRNDGIEVYHQRFESGNITPHLTARVKLWNSEERELDISSSFVELAPQRKLVLSIFRDVTERKSAEELNTAFAELGQGLSAAKTARGAGEVIVGIAERMFGCDSAWFGLYWPEADRLDNILSFDVVGGRRSETTAADSRQNLSTFARRVMAEGAQLILKEQPERMLEGSTPFGDRQRPSASIMGVPIRYGASVIGLLSIQSYARNAYNEKQLEWLQALADHCGGALERIRAEENLKVAQERMDHFLAESPAVIYSLRFQGDALVPAWRSRFIEQLVGFTAEEACRPEWFDQQVHPEDRPALANCLSQLLTQKRIVRDYRLRHKNGDYRWVRDELRLVCDPIGEPVEVVGSWVDITERKGLEDLLRQAQKMEAVGRLAGGVAHDFNNLLLVMRGNAELVLMDAEEYSETAKDCLKQIITAVERSANLTRQLLAFSRKQVMQSRALGLNDVIANLAKMLKRLIGEHIKLQCHYREGLPLVQADPGMIEQVLVNLVVNARDAMPRGGQLDITTDLVTLDPAQPLRNPEARPGEFVRLTVRDTGAGIAPEHLPRIFEPFFTTKEVGKGTGLGLATAYGIVKQHQGWLEVVSQPGAGATFKIFLPALSEAATGLGGTVAEPPLRGGNETILLVEDDPGVRSITRRMLESFGYQVHEAAQAREALAAWSGCASQIDLLLADIIMPEGITGRELAERLRVEVPQLKVVFMSGYNPEMAGKDTNFFRRTRSHFLQKPCSTRVLLETVRCCLDEN